MAVPRPLDARLKAAAKDGSGKVSAFPGPWAPVSWNVDPTRWWMARSV
jgi:hypothetical protein